jgi:SAM-dependent methyltransferase
MTKASAGFFTWVQGADFYTDLHRAALAMVTPDEGHWLDVGCGPGLVARLAADTGFTVTGIDRDPQMVRTARRRARGRAITFEVGQVEDLGPEISDVVSATSLLCTLPDPAAGLNRLWDAVRPGGTLLVVETTAAMTPAYVRTIASALPPRRRAALTLWARARHGRSLDPAILDRIPADHHRTAPLLHGLVNATILTRTAASGAGTASATIPAGSD